jgi:transketolase
MDIRQMPRETRVRCVDTIRFLAADAVEAANSGHPGTPMGAADHAFVVWSEFLNFDPAAPSWPNRDRFVLSGGHASMLLYSLLHLSGHDLPLAELKRFRQWGSKTPGHPEFRHTVGVELTTGPLGAGFATAVGMALASKMLAARFNTETMPVIDAHVFGICGDGDMQEGVTSEAASLAGHLGLGNLIFVYDSNDITIEGHLDVAMDDDVRRRFEAYGWYVQQVDGHDHDSIRAALILAKKQTVKPSLVIAKTVIGRGAPTKANTHGVHGTPLGKTELAAMRKNLGWPEETFHVPDEVRAVWTARAAEGKKAREDWERMFASWRTEHPDLAKQWDAQWEHAVPADLPEQLAAAVAGKSDATRSLSGMVIQKATALVPSLLGGAADLEPSTKTGIKGAASVVKASVQSDFLPDASFAGKNLHFGIREHAMGSMSNGMVLFGGWQCYSATFLVFSDYMRAPIRLAALSKLPTIFIFTHDSFWVGEDGPTHQPIEHLWSLRLIPDVDLWRPADGLETALAWAHAVALPDGPMPSILILTRQTVPVFERPAGFTARDIWKGGYVLSEAAGGKPELVILSTGSEVGPALEAKTLLEKAGQKVRLVSVPCVERFKRQPQAYRDAVLPPGVPRVSVEAGRTDPWYQFVGLDGLAIGIDHFGHSAPGEVLAEELGLTGAKIAARVTTWQAERRAKG